MLLTLALPRLGDYMDGAVIELVHAAMGDALAPGAKLFDLKVDLSTVVAHDCPPVSYYRIVLRDRAWLRRLEVGRGDEVAVGAVLARFSTTADEPLDGGEGRPLRVTVAGILHETDWWGERGE